MKEERKEIVLNYQKMRRFFDKIHKTKEIMYKSEPMPKPVNDWWLGMVRTKNLYVMKDGLKVGEIYYGTCRNADHARWNGEVFTYIRSKFGTQFPEDINHFEDDNGFDLFLPFFQITEDDINSVPYVKYKVDELKEYLDDKEERPLSESTTVDGSE